MLTIIFICLVWATTLLIAAAIGCLCRGIKFHRHKWEVTSFVYKRATGSFGLVTESGEYHVPVDYWGFAADYYLALYTTGISRLTEKCPCGKVRKDRWVKGRYSNSQEFEWC